MLLQSSIFLIPNGTFFVELILFVIVLGVVGSFVGGFLGFLIFGADAQEGFFQPAGIIGSIIGAIIVLIIWIQVRGRGAARR